MQHKKGTIFLAQSIGEATQELRVKSPGALAWYTKETTSNMGNLCLTTINVSFFQLQIESNSTTANFAKYGKPETCYEDSHLSKYLKNTSCKNETSDSDCSDSKSSNNNINSRSYRSLTTAVQLSKLPWLQCSYCICIDYTNLYNSNKNLSAAIAVIVTTMRPLQPQYLQRSYHSCSNCNAAITVIATATQLLQLQQLQRSYYSYSNCNTAITVIVTTVQLSQLQ